MMIINKTDRFFSKKDSLIPGNIQTFYEVEVSLGGEQPKLYYYSKLSVDNVTFISSITCIYFFQHIEALSLELCMSIPDVVTTHTYTH